MLILTSHDEAYQEAGNLCLASMLGYCKSRDHQCVRKWIPANYDRKPSWYKIVLLRRLLPHYERILWIDSDALLVGKEDIQDHLDDSMISLCEDKNGINCGVMAWRQSQEALDLLDEIYSKVEFLDHIWWEQAALMEILPRIRDKVQILPKVWNSYPSDFDAEPQILHWPGTPLKEKLPLMRSILQSIYL